MNDIPKTFPPIIKWRRYQKVSYDTDSISRWCWRRMEKISLTDHVRNEEVLVRGISYVKYENGRLTGLVTSYVETAF